MAILYVAEAAIVVHAMRAFRSVQEARTIESPHAFTGKNLTQGQPCASVHSGRKKAGKQS